MSEEMDFAQLVAQEDEIKLLEAENKRLCEALARISETLADVLDGSRVQEMQVRLGVQQDQLVALEADREKLLQLLKSASEVIGRFVSDEGWAQSDMDTMDTIDAEIAALEAEQRPMSLDELHEQGFVSRYDMISEANNYRG